ncbi:MAG TPA: maleylpyruvate isomerase family mycothiol-dependent enzyme [Jiangellaceae bacterium]
MTATNSELSAYIEAWSDSADRVIEIGRNLSTDEFLNNTDLPEWSVQDVYAHLAAIEAALAGSPDDAAALAMMKSAVITPAFTEMGVEARRGVRADAVIEELATHVDTRRSQLGAEPPEDPEAIATCLPDGLQWTWRTLLRNRAVDMWTHEQDIRRAVGRPGNLDGPGAHVTLSAFASSLPYVIGKRAGAPAGTVVALNVTGDAGFSATITVDENGRARSLDGPADAPDVDIATDAETFAMLASGRRDAGHVDVKTSGDVDLAAEILGSMVLTP